MFNHSCTRILTLAGTATGVNRVDIIAAEVVSHLSPGLLPLGKRKSGFSENGKWRGEAQFSSIFLYPLLPCTWHHIGYTLGDIRELAKQDVHTASGARMVRRCVSRCQGKW